MGINNFFFPVLSYIGLTLKPSYTKVVSFTIKIEQYEKNTKVQAATEQANSQQSQPRTGR
jgi:hypothetical protein